MPIDKDVWDEGRTLESPEARILTFLKTNSDQAYANTEDEIMEKTNLKTKFYSLSPDFSVIADFFRFHNAIEKLIAKGEVERRSIRTKSGQETYYRAK